MKCFVSEHRLDAATQRFLVKQIYLPCVTKLPKLRPTMQCHVAPFRLSNCGSVSARFGCYTELCLYLLLDILGNVLHIHC
jgi:hypothetical protein